MSVRASTGGSEIASKLTLVGGDICAKVGEKWVPVFSLAEIRDIIATQVDAKMLAIAVAAYFKEHPVKDGLDGEDGRDGVDGQPGKDGLSGKDGIDGKDGQPGRAGTDGRDGKQGPKGDIGASGKDGSDGADGALGKDGVDGEKGERGERGKDGTPGLQGNSGIDGKDGANGRDGIDGKDGADGKNGEAGAIGPVGVSGPQGEPGKGFIDLGPGTLTQTGPLDAGVRRVKLPAKGVESAHSYIVVPNSLTPEGYGVMDAIAITDDALSVGVNGPKLGKGETYAIPVRVFRIG